MSENNGLGLRDIQLLMKKIVTDPRGAEECVSSEPMTAAMIQAIHGTEREITARLSVYAEAYYLRLLESLKHDFSRTAFCVGEDTFRSLVASYLEEFPSRFANITEAGSNFALFLSKHAVLTELPFLGDLAEYEWTRVCCFVSEDHQKQNRNRECPLNMDSHIKLRPHVELLDLAWTVHKESKKYEHLETNLLLFRDSSFNVCVSELSKTQLALLTRLKSGSSLAAVFSQDLVGCSPENILSWFRDWSENGLLGIEDA